jgi:hypothetical protein
MSALRDMQDYAKAQALAFESATAIVPGRNLEAIATIDQVRERWPGVFNKSYLAPLGIEEPGQYTAFIHWPFQRENTPLGRAAEWDPEVYGPYDCSSITFRRCRAVG